MRPTKQFSSRFEVSPLTDVSANERVVGRVGVEPTTPAMSRRYPNQARPPAQYIMKKFVAQIYVVDRLYVGTN
jgi:hypothetical protein